MTTSTVIYIVHNCSDFKLKYQFKWKSKLKLSSWMDERSCHLYCQAIQYTTGLSENRDNMMPVKNVKPKYSHLSNCMSETGFALKSSTGPFLSRQSGSSDSHSDALWCSVMLCDALWCSEVRVWLVVSPPLLVPHHRSPSCGPPSRGSHTLTIMTNQSTE